jgi:hypothetical protein
MPSRFCFSARRIVRPGNHCCRSMEDAARDAAVDPVEADTDTARRGTDGHDAHVDGQGARFEARGASMPALSVHPTLRPTTIQGAWDDAWVVDGAIDDWSRGKRSDEKWSLRLGDHVCTPHAEPCSHDVFAESIKDMFNPALLRAIVVRERHGKSFFVFDDRVEVRDAAGDGLLQTVVYTSGMRGWLRRQMVDVSDDATLLLIDVVEATGTLEDEEDEGEMPARRYLYVADLDAQKDERVEPKPLDPQNSKHFYKFGIKAAWGARLLPVKWFDSETRTALYGVIALRGRRFGESVVPPARLPWRLYFVRPRDLHDLLVWCWCGDVRRVYQVSRSGEAELVAEESEENGSCRAAVHVEGLVAICGSRRTLIVCPALGRTHALPRTSCPKWVGHVLVEGGSFGAVAKRVWDGSEWVRELQELREKGSGHSTPTKAGDEGEEEGAERSGGAGFAAA